MTIFNTTGRIDVKKRSGTVEVKNLPLLYPRGREIDILKYNNLLELLPYVPPIFHKFYTDLQVKGNATNTNPDDDPMRLRDPTEFSLSENTEFSQFENIEVGNDETNLQQRKKRTPKQNKNKTCMTKKRT